MPRPILGDLPLWSNFTEYAKDVMELAAEHILKYSDLPLGEDELNRVLCQCIKRANKEMAADSRGFASAPHFDARNSPDENGDISQSYVWKRPDIKWEILDTLTNEYRNFDVECKRLGKPTKQRWVFNEKYFENGIRRFINVEHSYGRMAEVGMMVGFIQDSDPPEILREVNDFIVKNGTTPLSLLPPNWKSHSHNMLTQSFERSFPVSPFRLNHLWIDLRKKGIANSEESAPV